MLNLSPETDRRLLRRGMFQVLFREQTKLRLTLT